MVRSAASTAGREEAQADLPRCEQPGCGSAAEHRAPKSRDSGHGYWRFCLEHVREYNRAWNYFQGMSDLQIEAYLRADVTWHRPTWPLGQRSAMRFARGETRIEDGLGGFDFGTENEDRARRDARTAAEPARPRFSPDEERALSVLDLDGAVDLADVKSRYKSLVKQLHPDLNGGDPAAEEHLKRINLAYATLRASARLRMRVSA